MAESRQVKTLGTIDRGQNGRGQLRITLEESDGEMVVAIRHYFAKDGEFHLSKTGVTIKAAEIMQVGLALRRGLDALNSGTSGPPAPPAERLPPRMPTAVRSQPATTRAPNAARNFEKNF